MNPRLLLVLPAAWLLTIAPAPATSAATSPPATPTPAPTPTPVPTPTPSVGQVSLDPALGAPGGKITVSGSSFRAGEAITIFWDAPDKQIGAGVADGQGNFKIDVAAQGGDPGSSHSVCVLEQNPGPRCANFVLTAPTPAPTPVPSAAPTAASTPAPTAGGASPAPTLAPLPQSQQVSAVSVLLEPPFVFFPLLLVLAALGGAGYWIWSGTRMPRRAPAPAARVVHHAAHPPGTDPQAAPHPLPTVATSPQRGEASSAPPSPPAVSPPLRPLAGDEPLDLPEPGD